MTNPLIVIGFDGLEASVLEDAERHPAFAALRRRGAFGTMTGLHESLPDTAWAEIRTGKSAIRTGIYAAIQFRHGEARPRAARADELAPEHSYWSVAADAGKRVAVIDQPLAPTRGSGTESEVSGWGTHERPFGSTRLDPPLGEIVRRLGPHPVESCYALNLGTGQSRRRLLGAIKDGIAQHTALFIEAMGTAPWDLFTATYSEPHCAGHHFWPGVAGETGDPTLAEPGVGTIASVYADLDAALGGVLAAVPESATVIVYTPEGMAPLDGGALLVGDVLERLGLLASNRGRRRLSALVPERWRGPIRRLVGGTVLQRAGFTVLRDFGDGSTVAVPLPNPRHGAIRLGIAGRDPGGTLVPGSARIEETIGTIRAAFGELKSGVEPIVREVLLTDDLFGADRHPDLPDLIIRFRSDLGVIGECWSPRLGTIRMARRIHRTGDHGMPGAVWIAGPGIPPGSDLGEFRTIDFAPTVLAALGVTPPPWMEGTVRGRFAASS